MRKAYIKSIQSINFLPKLIMFDGSNYPENLPVVEVDDLQLVKWAEAIAKFEKVQAEILAAMNAAYGKDGS